MQNLIQAALGLGARGAVSGRQSGRILTLLSLMLCSAACHADMYKCVDANGNKVFSDKPCGPDAQAHNVKIPPHSAAFDSSTTLPDEMLRSYSSPEQVMVNSTSSPAQRHVVVTEKVHVVTVVKSRSSSTTASSTNHHVK